MRLTRRHTLAGLVASMATPVWADHNSAKGPLPFAVDLAENVENGPSALALQIRDEEKQPVAMADWLGTWTVLSFWGPWCNQCRNEMPSIARMNRQLDTNHARLLPLAFDWRGPYFVRKFLDEIEITDLPVYLGDGENLDATLGLSRLPTTAILDPEGRLRFTIAGEAIWDDEKTLNWLNTL